MKIKPCSLVGMTLAVGMSACGSHSAGSPSSNEQKQLANAVTQTGGVTIEKVDTPDPGLDLAEQPWFVTQGFVIASEHYKNLNSYTVQISPKQESASIEVSWQVLSMLGSLASTLVYSIPGTVSVTVSQSQYVAERVSDSVLGTEISLAPNEEMTLNWRVSPAPGLPYVPGHLGTIAETYTTTVTAQGTAITGQLARSVILSEGSDDKQEMLLSESLDVEKTSGTVGPPAQPNNSSLHSIWIDYFNSSPGDYLIPPTNWTVL